MEKGGDWRGHGSMFGGKVKVRGGVDRVFDRGNISKGVGVLGLRGWSWVCWTWIWNCLFI